MTPQERQDSVAAKLAQLKDDGYDLGAIHKFAIRQGSLWAFTDAGIIIAEPGVPGAYFLRA